MDTPENPRELKDAAWAVANGMRVMDEVVRRSHSLLIQLDLAEEKGRKLDDGSITHAREYLSECVGYTGLEDA